MRTHAGEFNRLMQSLKCRVAHTSHSHELMTYWVVAPAGQIFIANGGHMLREDATPGSMEQQQSAYASLAGQLKQGLKNCERTDCEACQKMRELTEK